MSCLYKKKENFIECCFSTYRCRSQRSHPEKEREGEDWEGMKEEEREVMKEEVKEVMKEEEREEMKEGVKVETRNCS